MSRSQTSDMMRSLEKPSLGRSCGSARTHSMENIQSLNAAYTTSPGYISKNDLDGTRSKTLSRLSSAGALSSSKKSSRLSQRILGSSPNLAMANYNGSSRKGGLFNHNSTVLLSSSSSNQSSGDNQALQVNGDSKYKRSSASDYILQMQQENETLRREIDIKESKLQSNMNSIKNFWSPELKKERILRKEESSRATVLREQFKASQDENQNLQLTIQALQDELRAQRDLNQLLQDDVSGHHNDHSNISQGSFSVDSRLLQEEVERLSRENELLQRTMEEMESRIEAQRQTLDARDESVQKLLEMLQSKSLSQQELGESETDSLKMQLVEAEANLTQLDSLLMERTCEIGQLKKSLLQNNNFSEDAAKIQSLQAVINMKDSKLATLEHDLHLLEEEVSQLKRDGAMTNEEHQEELKQLVVCKSHSTFMKTKIEQLKCELQKKDTMLVTMQTKLDTLNNQQSDSRQHIDVLKESLAAKEQRAAILQSEVDSLRTRLEEKQQVLDRKQEQLTVMQEERSTSGSELARLQDTLVVKDRKIAVLQRKIESLAEVVKEKDKQMEAMKERLLALQHDSSTSDSALVTMEEALTEKEKVIENLHSKLVADEEKWSQELDAVDRDRKSIEKALGSAKQDLNEKETNLSELKEHASSLASSSLKKDAHIKQTEINLQQMTEKLTQTESQLKKAQAELESKIASEQNQKEVAKLERIIKEKDEEAQKCQGDLDRLLEILKETENEKHEKDKKLIAIEKQVKDLQAKIKAMNNKMIEDSKLKGAALSKSNAQFLTQMKSKDERIEELEEALRESVSITAEREGVLAKESENVKKLLKEQEELVNKWKETKQVLDQTGAKLMSVEAMMHEKDRCLQSLRIERRQQLEELLEMKQESLLSAISEKDANIALLELSVSRKKTNADEVQALKKEKDRLMVQLKQQTENRLKLMQDKFDDAPVSVVHSDHHNDLAQVDMRHNVCNPRPSPTEDDGEGIWA